MQLLYYQTVTGRRPFAEWMEGLQDREARGRVRARLARLIAGSFGDTEPVGEGVLELRIDWGPGYRLYCARLGDSVVLLLCGGDKRKQDKDIRYAKDYFRDYKARTARKGRAG